ncbi:ATP-grasp domain-containing protein [Candidatus Gracilibacteria bacterium]|nr:ATP-grasp domain-containing protein [Candidatus Gracilibacteria bacterium]MCF7856728.1 ATP-grasp domain-containing protein [Candidatus Gracilibacteria bacterium]MCF7897034.1 ATP-grasp domain-containing protein [Candidatus Gracilibacteria bacterium]
MINLRTTQTHNFYVGALPKGLDDLIQALVFPKKQVFYFTAEGSSEAKWIAEFLPRAQILHYRFSTKRINFDKHSLENILRYSDLSQLLTKRKIKYLIFSNALNGFLEKWSEQHKIQIIAVSYRLQKRFENKLWFDKFLARHKIQKPESLIFNTAKTSKIFPGKAVLQKANSWGAEGTFFIENREDLERLIVAKKICKNENYLMRKYVSGKSYGITVFISSKVIAVSAIREQCFYTSGKVYVPNFAGIQWVADKNIASQLKKNINGVFTRLGELLHREKFLGYANFDFIADLKNEIYLIECNPRFAASSLQLLRFSELISNIQTEQIFIKEFMQKSVFTEPEIYALRDVNNFAGTNLQIKVAAQTKITKDYRNGLYAYQNGEIIYQTPDIRKLPSKGKTFIFHSNTSLGMFYPHSLDVANVISNFPLFGRSGKLNLIGRKILKTFTY